MTEDLSEYGNLSERDRLMMQANPVSENEKTGTSNEELHSLLLTAEQESRVDKGSSYTYTLRDGDEEITVHGKPHSREVGEIKDLIAAFDESNPELLLTEGEAAAISQDILDGKHPEISALPPEQQGQAIIDRFGEQGFMAWYARVKGKEVKVWDIPIGQVKLRELQTSSGKENTILIAYLITQGLTHLDQDKYSAQALIDLISDNFHITIEDLANAGFTVDRLNQVSQEYLGKPIEQISPSEAAGRSDPTIPGETNQLLERENIIRDKRAIDVIVEEKKKHNKIFVMGGSSHAVTWQRALQRIYPESK